MSGKVEKTKIKFKYEDKEYILEYTAASLKKMERDGFNIGEMESMVLSMPEKLFEGAFIANHANVPVQVRNEIFHSLTADTDDGESLMEILVTMMNEAIEEINYHSGNTKWEVVR